MSSSSSSSNTITPTLNQFQNTFSIKLTPNNYLAWKTQFQPLINYHSLQGYIDGSNAAPPATLIDSKTSQPIPNPEYLHWFHQDQMLLAWLFSSLTEEVYPYIIGLSTSYDVWTALFTAFGAVSQSKQIQLHIKLQELKPDEHGIAPYLQKAKLLVEELALSGKPLLPAELNAIIYRNAGLQFHSVIAALSVQKPPPTFQTIVNELTSYELILRNHAEHEASVHFSSAPAALFSPTVRPSIRSTSSGNTSRVAPGRFSSQSLRQPRNRPPVVICQICNIPNHTAATCRRRYNTSGPV